jgi:hypothetical protein
MNRRLVDSYLRLVTIVLICVVGLVPLFSISGASSWSFTAEATSAAYSTLEARDADITQQVKKLLSTNGGCGLPCWWGLKVGASTNDIKSFLQKALGRELGNPFVRQNGLIDYYLNLIFIPQTDSSLAITFTTKSNQLELTTVTLTDPNLWLLGVEWGPTSLLKQMGRPTEIYLSITPSTNSFSLLIPYNDLGVMAQYILVFKNNQFTEDDRPIQLCFHSQQIIYSKLWLQKKTNDMVAEHLLRNPSGPTSKYFPTIKAMTGLEIPDFLTLLTTEPNKCVKALSYQQLIDKAMN